MASASAASASAGGASVSTSAASAAAGGASSAASSAAAAGGASSASSSAATSVVVVNQNATAPVVPTYRSNNSSLCWCCFGLLFITLIIAVTGVVLGVYAAYIATIIPILYGMNMCYQAKKEGEPVDWTRLCSCVCWPFNVLQKMLEQKNWHFKNMEHPCCCPEVNPCVCVDVDHTEDVPVEVQVVPKAPEPLEVQDIPSVPSPSAHTPPAASMAPSPSTTAPVETPPPYHEIYPGQTQPNAMLTGTASQKNPQGFPGPHVPADQLSLLADPVSTQSPYSLPGPQSNPSPMDPAELPTQSDASSPHSSSEPSASAGPSDPQHPSAGRPRVEDAGPLPRKMRTFQD